MDLKRIILVWMSLVLVGICLVGQSSAADQDLAEQFAPILYFESGETCYPVDVSYALENSYLYQIGDSTPILTTLTATLLQNNSSAYYYLDNQRGTVDAGDTGIITSYQSELARLGYTVYANVDNENDVIQYWFFYAFNAGDLNRHEGDWEMVQVVLSSGQPSQVMVSQHYSGQSAQWNQVEKEGDHVKIYVARGSHANYLRSYSGKFGLASDTVGSNGRVLQPTDYTVEILDVNTHPWLEYQGRWGWVGADAGAAVEASLLGEAGPQGPMFRENGAMWEPFTWAAGLPAVNETFFILDWLLYNFGLLFVLLTALTLAIVILLMYRRYKKHGLGPRKLSLLYIDGMNTKSIGNILCIVAIVVALLGLVYPWYAVNATISIPSYAGTGEYQVLTVDGLNGIQIRLPNAEGPMPLGAFTVPFYLLIAIGLLFLILSTVGISQSKKLGKKYMTRGVRLLVPFILILIFIMAVGSIIPMVAPADLQDNAEMLSAMNAISSSPFSGDSTIPIAGTGGGVVSLHWGFGIGIYLLLFAGIILLMAGLIEWSAHATFFEEKEPIPVPPSEDKK
ncbi:MAG: Vps62-related protein [Candidatus Thermoplasmatota archaeon]|nr:Vps62-related protein [Candidatus Thermoplasmatota archaeon]